MQSIELLRYIKRWLWLIIVCMILGVLFVYKYATGHQSYTASVVINYNNIEASLMGYSPDGKTIDPSEIYSAAVVSDVIDELKLSGSIEAIRQNCKVTEVIPADIQTLKKNALENGEEYTYYPTKYIVSFTSKNEAGTSYVLQVLDALMESYYRHYAQQHVIKATIPNNSANISTDMFDYLECAEIIGNSVTELVNYCTTMNAQAPKFRSAATGYSFQDLLSIYEYYSESLIPKLYASVLNGSMTNSRSVLLERYKNNIAMAQIRQQNLNDQIEKTKALIDNYVEKEKEGIEYHFGRLETNDYILNQVYDDDDELKREYTVYDQLIFHYASLLQMHEILAVQISHDQDILSYYEGKSFVLNEETKITAEMLHQLPEVLDQLYQILCQTVDEYNDYAAAQSISNLTNISTSKAINVELYMLLAVMLFGVLGVLGAIFLGRLGDLIEYLVYIDKRVGVYNRARCDWMIDELSKKLLSEQFGCLAVRVNNLTDLNRAFGREKGDKVLRTYAGCLKQVFSSDNGFVGYNDGAMFLCFVENHSSAMLAEMLEDVGRNFDQAMEQAEMYDVAAATRISAGVVNSTDDKCYQVRKLLQLAIARSREEVKE